MYDLFEKYLLYYELPEEGRNSLREAAKQICADKDELSEAIKIKNRIADRNIDFKAHEELKEKTPQFNAFTYTLAIEDMEKYYIKNNISKEIMTATILDLGIWIKRHYERRGQWGFSEVGWLVRHIRGELFRLGRLQFEKETSYDVTIFKNDRGDIVMIPPEGSKYTEDGLRDYDNPDTLPLITEIYEDEKCIKSNIVYENGYALKKDICLDKENWHVVLKPHDPILNVHIPRGEKMTEESCLDSFEQAVEFYSDYPFKAFGCYTWLFDAAFEKLLPRDSNILKFQRMFLRFPGGESYDGLSYVFVNINRDNINEAPLDTAFRRSLAEFIKAGGKMHTGGGYRLK